MKDIEGYGGRYKISENGSVYDYEKNRWVQSHYQGTTYEVKLEHPEHGTCSKRIHFLMAETYLADGRDIQTVKHLDKNPANNKVDNLTVKYKAPIILETKIPDAPTKFPFAGQQEPSTEEIKLSSEELSLMSFRGKLTERYKPNSQYFYDLCSGKWF